MCILFQQHFVNYSLKHFMSIDKIFVNIPVKGLERSKEFFTKLGFTFNPQFTDENAACMIISQHIYVMLLTESFFKGFINKQIADTSSVTETILALATESRNEVDEIMQKVLGAGGTEPRPAIDHGFMYQRSFQDCDGHLWEIFYMDPSHIQ